MEKINKISTTSILKNQYIEIINNFKFYFFLALPYIILNIIIYNYPTENIFLLILMVFISYLLVIPVAVGTHQKIILNKKIKYFDSVFNYTESIRYFYYSFSIFIFSYLPISISLGFFYGSLETYSYFSESFAVASVIIFLILFIFGVLFSFFLYPSLAFCLPKASIGEIFKIKDVFKSTKGFRLTIFFQTWIIYLLSIILFWFVAWSLGLLYESGVKNNFTIESTILIVVQVFIDTFCIILGVGCLSKTYLIFKEKDLH